MDIKNEYKKYRNIEKKKLVEVLKRNGYKATDKKGTGHGRENYTNGHTIKEYDLSNWIWLTGEKKDDSNSIIVDVYFQSFDTDIRSKNTHVLFDRLSYSFSINGKESGIISTDYDLPLEEADYQKLILIIESEIEKAAKDQKL